LIGLYYCRARYYDTAPGRFLSEDPLRFFSGEVNFYGYAEGNPLNLTDPLGLSCHCTYSQATGHIKCVDNATGKVVAEGNGYAGYGHGKNDPDMQNVGYVGPLPRGDYRMGPTLDRKKTGPMTIMLMYIGGAEPFPTNRAKDMFRIHGDSKKHPGDASEGCIVQGGDVRKKITNGCGKGSILSVEP